VTESSTNGQFQVDLGGMVELLSKNLYSSGDVYLRELLQNGVDAITAKGLPPEKGRIRFIVAPPRLLPTILEALTKAGFRPTRDTEIRIEYKNEGYFCYFCYREDEPDFLMAQANFERGAFGTEEELLLLRACAKTNCLT